MQIYFNTHIQIWLTYKHTFRQTCVQTNAYPGWRCFTRPIDHAHPRYLSVHVRQCVCNAYMYTHGLFTVYIMERGSFFYSPLFVCLGKEAPLRLSASARSKATPCTIGILVSPVCDILDVKTEKYIEAISSKKKCPKLLYLIY